MIQKSIAIYEWLSPVINKVAKNRRVRAVLINDNFCQSFFSRWKRYVMWLFRIFFFSRTVLSHRTCFLKKLFVLCILWITFVSFIIQTTSITFGGLVVLQKFWRTFDQFHRLEFFVFKSTFERKKGKIFISSTKKRKNKTIHNKT